MQGRYYALHCIAANEEDVRFGKLVVAAPVIVSPPKDSYGPLGANLTLDCEARGFPAPEISWKFVSAKGETTTLPSKFHFITVLL